MTTPFRWPRVQVVLSALILLALLTPLAPTPVARAADSSLVFEALRLLRANYVKTVDPVKVLNAAVGSLHARLSDAGVAIELPEIPPGTSEADARRLFIERFATALTAGASGGLTETQLAYQAIRGMTESFQDSHTGFLTPEQNRERQKRQRGQAGYNGVGIVLLPKDGKFFVRSVIPGTPSEAAGVKDFDRILRVNDVPTGGLTVEQVSEMIRGFGTVTLTLQRPGLADPLTITMARTPIHLPSIFKEQLLDGGIGYIHLYQFVDGTGAEFRAALGRLLSDGMRALILDIRGNSGGFLHELNSVLNALLPSQLPVYIEMRSGGGTRVVRTTGSTLLPPQIPLVVLIDEASASAAELLAAAIQENRRGSLVGEKTAGAVAASILVDLSDASALSVTVFEMVTSRGARLETVGVKPNVAAALTTFDLETGQDRQLGWALRLVHQILASPVLR